MYAVIFTAKIKHPDDKYAHTAKRMRQLATERYGCTEFNSVTEGDREISISYWPTLEHIQRWKNDTEHLIAQKLGQERWYSNYRVDVVELTRTYTSGA